MLDLVTLGLMPRQVTPSWMYGLVSGQVAPGRMPGLVTLGLMPRQVTPVKMCGLVSGQVATGKMLGLVTLGLMLGQVTPGRMRGLSIPGTISRRVVVYLSDPSITSSFFISRHTANQSSDSVRHRFLLTRTA